MTVFHPEHSALDHIFSASTVYLVPEYQRPYSWQSLGKSDKNNQINQMWEDLWSFFEDNNEGKEYFFGSMVVIEKERRVLEVIDGQQRLTSLILLFGAMRCFLQRCLKDRDEGKLELSSTLETFVNSSIETLKRFIYNEKTFGLAPELKVKIERSAGYDFGDLLSRAAGCEPTPSLPNIDPENREVGLRYFINRDFFLERLEEVFRSEQGFPEASAMRFDGFFRFLQTRVAIVIIKTTDFDTAFSIFEILNNRGLPLTSRDLLRNFVIKEFSNASVPDGSKKWYSLESEYPLTEDFTGRWVESINASKQRYSAFNDIKAIYARDYIDSLAQKGIERFYNDVKRDLRFYSLIVEEDQRVTHIELRNRIKLIKELGNLRYSTNLLLALLRYYRCDGEVADPELIEFIRTYQQYALHSLMAPGSRFLSAPVFEAIRLLRDQNPEQARQRLELDEGRRDQLRSLIGGRMDNYLGKLLIAAHVWQSEIENEDDLVTQSLQYSKASLEHIIPQSPAKGSNWQRDFTEDFRANYTYRLGNMTLLTVRMNSGAKNSDFAKKKAYYRRTALATTRELAVPEQISETFIQERHGRIVQSVCQHLGL